MHLLRIEIYDLGRILTLLLLIVIVARPEGLNGPSEPRSGALQPLPFACDALRESPPPGLGEGGADVLPQLFDLSQEELVHRWQFRVKRCLRKRGQLCGESTDQLKDALACLLSVETRSIAYIVVCLAARELFRIRYGELAATHHCQEALVGRKCGVAPHVGQEQERQLQVPQQCPWACGVSALARLH